MNEPIYQLRELVKGYGGRNVLEIGELDIRRGEILAIVGPSGAGKSTLLRLLNFLEPPSAGSISFLGRSYDETGRAPLEVRRRITTVAQRPVLLNRTVWRNVRFGLDIRGRRDGNGEVSKALGQVGLQGLAQQQARTLSGGEAQRVALARALVLQPDVLLLDEPSANLDPFNVSQIESIVRQTNLENGTTIVLVTHNIFQARRLAHRTALLLEGRLTEVADTDRFFEEPGDPRTRAFVRGEMIY